jgi:hypothetical protein
MRLKIQQSVLCFLVESTPCPIYLAELRNLTLQVASRISSGKPLDLHPSLSQLRKSGQIEYGSKRIKCPRAARSWTAPKNHGHENP